MRNAVILDYAEGTIDILPIPDNVPTWEEEDFVRMHPAYNSDEHSYMIVDGDIEIYKVVSDTPTYLPIINIADNSVSVKIQTKWNS